MATQRKKSCTIVTAETIFLGATHQPGVLLCQLRSFPSLVDGPGSRTAVFLRAATFAAPTATAPGPGGMHLLPGMRQAMQLTPCPWLTARLCGTTHCINCDNCIRFASTNPRQRLSCSGGRPLHSNMPFIRGITTTAANACSAPTSLYELFHLLQRS